MVPEAAADEADMEEVVAEAAAIVGEMTGEDVPVVAEEPLAEDTTALVPEEESFDDAPPAQVLDEGQDQVEESEEIKVVEISEEAG